MKSLFSIFILFACLCHGQQDNIWRDPDFERNGIEMENAHSGTHGLRLHVGEKEYWAFASHDILQVTPYALYRATAYVRSDGHGGGHGKSLFFYGQDSFGWGFVAETAMPIGPEWQRVTITFSVPDSSITFHPLVFNNSSNATAEMDDLEIVMELPPEEHIRRMEQVEAPTQHQCQLLGRHYLATGQMEAFQRVFEKANDLAKSDLSCLLAKAATDPATVSRHVSDMLHYGAMHYPEGPRRWDEFLAKLPTELQWETLSRAIRQGMTDKDIATAMDLLQENMCKSDMILPKAFRENMLAEITAYLNAGDTLPGAAVCREALESMQAYWRDSVARIGDRRVAIGGVPLKTGQTAIVLPPDATPSERTAADDLRGHLEEMTGETLPIIEGTDGWPKQLIFVGRNPKLADYGFRVDYAKLGLEGIHIEAKGGNLLLAGGKRGVLYAVYSFLEDHLDCRWFTADCIRLPNTGTVELEDFRTVYVPPLEYRDVDYISSRPFGFSVRNKLNGTYMHADKQWGGHVSYMGFGHTMYALVNPDVYRDSHPEYFSELNGKRICEDAQLCLTNPDVVKIATESIRRWLRENPDATIFSVSQNDNMKYCQCAACTALAEKEGSQSGPIIHFVNAIADAVRDEYPDKLIDTFAYTYSRKPPKFVKPAPNVCVRLCSIECCFSHPLDSDCPMNLPFAEDIIGWSKICNRLYVWDYVISFWNSLFPFPNMRSLKPNIEFFVKHNVTGIYEEGNYFSKGAEMGELRSYIMAKCLWNPDYDTEKAIREFTDGYFGAAGSCIREYIDLIHNAFCIPKETHVNIGATANNFLLVEPGVLEKATEILQRAEKMVADDPVLLFRVQVARLPIIGAKQELCRTAMKLEGNKLVPYQVVTDEEQTLFEETARKVGMTQVSEGDGSLDKWLDMCHDPVQSHDIYTLENETFVMKVIPSIGGRIWDLKHKATDFQLICIMKDANGNISPYNGGYEEYNNEGYRSGGYKDDFQILEADSRHIRMRCEFNDGSIATRLIELLPDQPGFTVDTQYTAKTTLPPRSCRVHPEFYVPDSKAATLLLRRPDGSFTTTIMDGNENELWLKGEQRPAGEWRIQFELPQGGKATLTDRFLYERTSECYVNRNIHQKRMNLEIWSAKEPLSPTSGPRQCNTYLFTVE